MSEPRPDGYTPPSQGSTLSSGEPGRSSASTKPLLAPTEASQTVASRASGTTIDASSAAPARAVTTSTTTTTTRTTAEPAVSATAVSADDAPASAASANPAPARGVKAHRTRKARLRLARLDPWSMMKTAFLFSIAGGIMFWVATYVVWGVIGSSGLFDALNKMVASIVEAPGDQGKFKIETYVSTNKVLGLSALLAVVNIVIFTALATLGSFLYNLSATMLGGIEVTLAED